jgi:hypothetical protein
MEKHPDNTPSTLLKDVAHILDVAFLALLDVENIHFMQKINQQGGQAATKLIFQNQLASMEHSELIKSMHEEIEFLRSLVVKLQEGK